jgi:hypothetical protein
MEWWMPKGREIGLS